MENSFTSLVKSKPVKQEVSHTFPYGDCSIAKSQKFKITKNMRSKNPAIPVNEMVYDSFDTIRSSLPIPVQSFRKRSGAAEKRIKVVSCCFGFVFGAVLAGVAVAGVTYFYFQSSNHFFEGERASIPGNGKGSGARIEGVVSDQFCS